MTALGVDLGASKTILVVDGDRVETVREDTPREGMVEFVDGLVSSAWSEDIGRIGLSVAGTVDRREEEILATPNLTGLAGLPLKRHLEGRGVPVVLENDGNCFTYGEFVRGAGRDRSSAVGLTLGTGVGAGAVLGGEPLRGAFGSGFEVGHMIIREGGARCSCGSRGCLEAYASNQLFLREGIDAREAQLLAEKGDGDSLRLYRELGKWLGIGISNLVNLLDPEVVILGGGLSAAYHLFIEEVRSTIQSNVLSPASREGVEVVRADLGDLAPAIGAALLPARSV